MPCGLASHCRQRYNFHRVSTAEGAAMRVAREHPAGIAAAPAFSLLRLSALARCGGAMVVIAGLWAMVFWALA